MEVMKPENVKKYFDEMIADLATLVSYPSVYADDEGTPFGINNKECLHAALKIAEGYGFKTVNVDDYCGYIEMGQGEQIIGILAHLDVVPVSDTWASDPFRLTLIDGKYYGRGTSDDKGAAICSLTALRMLKPLEHTFTKRIRLILGCNEESGSAGIAHYVEKFGYVDCGFTPDGAFPLTFGEKGMVRGLFTGESSKISDIKGGTVSNAVAAMVKVTLKDGAILDTNKLESFLKENELEFSFDGKVLSVKGAAAHASTPQFGKNAISFAMEALYAAGINDELVDAYHELIGTTYNGEKLGIDFKDDYGNLTFNIGLAFMKEEKPAFTIDIRFPVTMNSAQIIEPLMKNGKNFINDIAGSESLFFAPDHPMIKALMKSYVDVTGDNETKPFVMGGGTYAKEMKGIVAFGCDDNKHNYRIHDDNEFITEESMLMQTACYYEAVLNLMKI